MITIKCGKLFVEKYNEMNETNLTPKEIFCMLAEKAFKGGRHMVNWTNSKFFQYLKDYNKFLKKNKDEPSFQDALNAFCNDLENRNCGIETSINVYGGCAESNKNKTQTTEFNYCDNLHFTIDERYCSFIGSFFQIMVNGFSTTINDKDIIWMMYESFNKYYDFIHNNDGVKDKQLPTWNGLYFYETVMDRKGYALSALSKNGFSTINFLEFLEAISKLTNKNIETLLFEKFGETNTSCGYITIDLEGVSGWFKIFKTVLSNIDEEFDIKKYADIFGKNNLIFIAIENGEITKKMLNPLEFFKNKEIINEKFKKQNGIKFLKEYIKLIMTKQEIDMAKDFANFLVQSSKSDKKTFSMKIELDNIFTSKNVTNLIENIIVFCKKSGASKEAKEISNVVNYFIEDLNQTKLREFLIFTKFNF